MICLPTFFNNLFEECKYWPKPRKKSIEGMKKKVLYDPNFIDVQPSMSATCACLNIFNVLLDNAQR